VNPLARIAYNMIAEGGEAAARSSGDDVLKAAAKIADEGIDDWGWKGGKPGEMSGTEYMKEYQDIQDITLDETLKELKVAPEDWDDFDVFDSPEAADLYDKLSFMAESELANEVVPQIKDIVGEFPEVDYVRRAMENFATLEAADTPRKWTGKLYNPLQNRDSFGFIKETDAQIVSNLMRNMTESQREEFVALLPEWTESLDDLANAVRML